MKRMKLWLLVGAVLVTSVPVPAGDLEPPGAPAPTMVTLQEIHDEVSPPPDTCFDNVGRFVVCEDGTVKDNLTGLIWMEDAGCFGSATWADANKLAAQVGDGQCGLTDGSSPGDWRLPTDAELNVILDRANVNSCTAPLVPDVLGLGCCGTGVCAFTGLQNTIYWSSTTYSVAPNNAWAAIMTAGIGFSQKINTGLAWPVRSGP